MVQAEGAAECVCVWGGGGGALDGVYIILTVKIASLYKNLVAIDSETDVNEHEI